VGRLDSVLEYVALSMIVIGGGKGGEGSTVHLLVLV